MAGCDSADWQKLLDLEQWRARTAAEIERQTAEWLESGEAIAGLAGSEKEGESG
jgi:hypothetical protein